MNDWLREIHLLALLAWGGGLLLLSLSLWRGRGDNLRYKRIYLSLSAPGAFLSLLSGIWILHSHPNLFKEESLRLRLLLFSVLLLLDALSFMAIKREVLRRFSPLLYGGILLLLIAHFALAQWRPV